MSLKKSVGFVSLAAIVGAISYGCSSTNDATTPSGDEDGGGPGDSGGRHDSSGSVDSSSPVDSSNSIDSSNPADGGGRVDGSVSDAARDAHPSSDSATDGAARCQPGDVSGFAPPAYVPAHRQLGVCTPTQINDFYTHCFDVGRSTAACDADKAAAPTCTTCLEVPSTASSWGATYTHNGVVTVNVAGCMEILGGTAGLDCAKKSQVSAACDDSACVANCPIIDDASFQLYLACVQQAATNGCMAYAAATQPAFRVRREDRAFGNRMT